MTPKNIISNLLHFTYTDAYDASHMTYKWKKKPGIKITDRKMAQFQLVKFETVGKLEVYAAGEEIIIILSAFRIFTLFIHITHLF